MLRDRLKGELGQQHNVERRESDTMSVKDGWTVAAGIGIDVEYDRVLFFAVYNLQ